MPNFREARYGKSIPAIFELERHGPISGQIHLKKTNRGESHAALWDAKRFQIESEASLFGVCEEGKVSLIKCLGGTPGYTSWDDFLFYRCNLYFSYALFGNYHVKPSEECIRGIRFSFREIDKILSNHGDGVFGSFFAPKDELVESIERLKPKHVQPSSWQRDSAIISYFNGNMEVLPKTKTVLGTISAFRLPSVSGSRGVIDDTAYIEIDFSDAPVNLYEALHKMRTVRQFFSLLIGHIPTWKEVRVFTGKLCGDLRDDAEGKHDEGLNVFAPSEESLITTGPKAWKSFVANEVLVDASRDAVGFTQLMFNWLQRNDDEERKQANLGLLSLAEGFPRGTVDRNLVAAANMFDHIPRSDKPEPRQLTEDVVHVLDCARKSIKGLKGLDKEERNRVLGQLGNVNADSSLRRVIDHRARVVTETIGSARLPSLNSVIAESVRCRNFYTHGSPPKSKYGLDFSDIVPIVFFTETLKFIYETSELIECGWDMNTWLESAPTWHRFPSFLGSYKLRIEELGISHHD